MRVFERERGCIKREGERESVRVGVQNPDAILFVHVPSHIVCWSTRQIDPLREYAISQYAKVYGPKEVLLLGK